jgi:hypothetical protein
VYSPLVFRDGELYGFASGGSSACGQFGCGSVFRLTPSSGGGGTDSRSGIVSAGENAQVRRALMRVRGAVSSVVRGSNRL